MTENEIANKVIGIGIEIHKVLGPGLLESVYKKSLRTLRKSPHPLRLKKAMFYEMTELYIIKTAKEIQHLRRWSSSLFGFYRHLTPTESSYDILMKKIIEFYFTPEGLNVYKEGKKINLNSVGVRQSNINSMQFSLSLEQSRQYLKDRRQ